MVSSKMPVVKSMITAAQVKAARALLGLSQNELAKKTGLGIATIKRLELSTELRGAATTLWKVQTVLENAGVEFLTASSESGPGSSPEGRCRLREAHSKEAVNLIDQRNGIGDYAWITPWLFSANSRLVTLHGVVLPICGGGLWLPQGRRGDSAETRGHIRWATEFIPAAEGPDVRLMQLKG